MKKIRTRMTVMIMLVVLISSGMVSLISYRRAHESVSSHLENSYSLAADKYAQELTAWINSKATIIETLAAEIAVSGVDRSGYEAFHRYLAECCERLNTSGHIYDIYFTYPDNTMACASDFVADGSVDYVHSREWFYIAVMKDELFYSTPYRDSDSGQPIVTISRAVFADGELRGVIAADIFVDVLVNIISEADVAPDSYAFLVDRKMDMIVHPNPAYAYDDVPRGVMDVPDSPYNEVVANIKADCKDTVYLTDYDGVTRGVVVSRISDTGLYVGIATNKAELMQDMNRLMRSFLIAALIAVVIGVLSAVFLAREMVKLSRLQEGAEK